MDEKIAAALDSTIQYLETVRVDVLAQVKANPKIIELESIDIDKAINEGLQEMKLKIELEIEKVNIEKLKFENQVEGRKKNGNQNQSQADSPPGQG